MIPHQPPMQYQMNYQEKEIYNYCIRLLARRPYHSAELRTKIIQQSRKRKTTAIGESIEKVLSFLAEKKFIDDHEFIIGFVKNQQQRQRGQMLIRQKLKQKNIKLDHDIESAINQNFNEENELKTAILAAQKKLKTLSGKKMDMQKKKEMIMRFLLSRGYRHGTSQSALERLYLHQPLQINGKQVT